MSRAKPTTPLPRRPRLTALRRARITIAALVFLLALAAFLDFRNLVPEPLKHAFASTQFVPSALTLATAFTLSSLACIAILALTLAFGRVYCSMLCPLGILQDIISRVSALIRRKPPYKLPRAKPRDILRHGILALTLIAIAAGFSGIALAWLDPYSNFGRIATTLLRPLAIAANNLAATIATALGRPDLLPQAPLRWFAPATLLPPLIILLALIITAALRGRLWCNTICPVGTTLGLISRRSLWRLTIDKTACLKCGDCLRACKAQCIDLRASAIDHSRCVACYNCVTACDERGIRHRWQGLSAGSAEFPLGGRREAPPKPPSGNSALPDTNRRAFIATAATAALTAAATATRLAPRAHAQDNAGVPPANEGRPDPRHDQGQDAGRIPSAGGTPALPFNPDSPAVVAPPGARTTARLLAQCTACQLCISACPSRVLEPAVFEYGSFAGIMKPRLNHARGFCNFNCAVCADVCPDTALTPLTLAQKQLTRIGLARVTLDRCIIVAKHTKCGSCAEHCPTAALQIKSPPYYPDPVPVIDPRYCIGCGGCAYACPAPQKAIAVNGLAIHETAEKLVQEKVTQPATGDFAF